MRRKEGRTIGLYTKVTPEEKAVIDQKMALLGTKNRRAYLRKMAVDGYIVNIDMSDIKAMIRLLKICGNQINQIAKRANETRNVYASDVEDVKRRYEEIWESVSRLLEKFEILQR